MVDEPQADPALADFISRTTGLDQHKAGRVIAEVLAYYTETVEDYVRRRHSELKNSTDLRNAEIYNTIAGEIRLRPFCVAELSERQVRRMIYG